MRLACESFAQRAGMEIEIEIEIGTDWMSLPSGMRPIDPDFDFDFDSSVASRASPGPLFGCGLWPIFMLSVSSMVNPLLSQTPEQTETSL